MALLNKKYGIWPTTEDAAQDERAFDVKLVRSTLAWHAAKNNAVDVVRAGRELEWIRTALKRRAETAGVVAMIRAAGEQSYWTSPDESAQVRAAFAFALFMGGGMHRRALNASQESWLEKILSETPVYGRLRLGSGMSTVPWVNTIERATAYVMETLIEDRYSLARSIRLCPFTGRGVPAPHLFLDYRLDEHGNFQRGQAQRFCCPAHANAYGQSRTRARARAARTARKKK